MEAAGEEAAGDRLTALAVDPSRCPRCGGPNACTMAAPPSRAGARDEPCWCTRVDFPAALIDALPADAKGVACLCAACIASFGAAR